MSDNFYESPTVEILDLLLEQGFAASNEPLENEDWN